MMSSIKILFWTFPKIRQEFIADRGQSIANTSFLRFIWINFEITAISLLLIVGTSNGEDGFWEGTPTLWFCPCGLNLWGHTFKEIPLLQMVSDGIGKVWCRQNFIVSVSSSREVCLSRFLSAGSKTDWTLSQKEWISSRAFSHHVGHAYADNCNRWFQVIFSFLVDQGRNWNR